MDVPAVQIPPVLEATVSGRNDNEIHHHQLSGESRLYYKKLLLPFNTMGIKIFVTSSCSFVDSMLIKFM